MRSLVVGATGGVGRALCRELAAQGHSLVMVARDPMDLHAEAANLCLRFGIDVEIVSVDAADPEGLVAKILEQVAPFPPMDNLLFPIGASRDDDNGSLPSASNQNLVAANLVCIMDVVAAYLPGMSQRGRGNLIGFGSIAAVRGRSSNIVYAAAKRGLESYFESLRHLTVASGVFTQFYRLGYISTQQSFGKHLFFPVVSPEYIARRVVRGLNKDIGRASVPRFWGGIAWVVRALPWQLFRRLHF